MRKEEEEKRKTGMRTLINRTSGTPCNLSFFFFPPVWAVDHILVFILIDTRVAIIIFHKINSLVLCRCKAPEHRHDRSRTTEFTFSKEMDRLVDSAWQKYYKI
jgi:hypothetical protein